MGGGNTMPAKNTVLRIALRKMWLYIISFLVLISMSIVFTSFMRKLLLNQHAKLGDTIASRYAIEMEGDLNMFSSLIAYGTSSLDYRGEVGMTSAEIFEWLNTYYEQVIQVFGNREIEPYIVYNGQLSGAHPWEGDSRYDYKSTEWYKKAVEADGEVIITDAYIDAVTEKPVITVAQKCKTADAIIAFDLTPQSISIYNSRADLPEESSIYICDSNGALIYCNSILGIAQEEIDEYVKKIDKGMKDGSLVDYDSFISDPKGAKRGIYSAPVSVGAKSIGWNVYITIPYRTMMAQLKQFYMIFLVFGIPCLFILIIMMIRAIMFSAETELANETVQVLGNQYFALYRINFEKDTYDMIKGSEYVKECIPKQGSYQDLLDVCSEVIESSAIKDFRENFSMESIRNLVSKQVKDFGGDFLRKFDNGNRWVSVRILFDKSLSSHEAVLCFREIETEKQQQFQERKLLNDALAIAKRSEKSKQAFFSNMSHDMRTPLNAILNLSDLALTEDNLTDKARGYLEKIAYSGRQLLNLVNDILDMSRMEQGKVVLDNQVIDLEDCLQECIAPFRLQAEAEKKNFNIDIDIKNKNIIGDSVRINQLLNNLLSNAFKFTSENDSVSLSAKQIDSVGRVQYQFVVKDTGTGMSKEFLPQLFEPYSRETRFSNRRVSGTGLGMPIVKNLVTEMSGQIYVDSELGKGTTFTITIPFILAKSEPVRKKQDESKMLNSLHEFSLKGKKILLAEDNVLNMEIATEILTMNGIEIVQAWNGEEAVKAFNDSSPFEIDAILMDMQMPKMDGCEAAQHIRTLSRPDAAKVPIIAVTANAFAEDIAATSAAGMNAHISKPIDFKVLCQTLEKLTRDKVD